MSFFSGPETPQPENLLERWTAELRAAIVLEVLKGQLSSDDACRTYRVTPRELRAWSVKYHRGGVAALMRKRPNTDAQYHAEIRRLQKEIGELRVQNALLRQTMRRSAVIAPMPKAILSTSLATVVPSVDGRDDS